MIEQKVFEFIDARADEMINDISKLVEIPSIKGESKIDAPFGEEPKRALKMALEICRSYGFSVKNIENAIGYADMNENSLGLGILAHADVVPVGDGWESDPFKISVRDGKMFGRGTSDDKGPMMAALMAMRAIKECGIELTKNARLIIGSDEECGSGDLKYYFGSEETPPYSFSPDAEFPLINTEKGRFAPYFYRYVGDESNVIPRITYFDSGVAVNAVPNIAKFRVKGYDRDRLINICKIIGQKFNIIFETENNDDECTISANGIAAHASLPEMGNNALTASLELIKELKLPECGSNSAFCGLNKLFPHNDFYGNAMGLEMEDRISGKLTLTFDVLKYDGKKIEGYFDSRMPLAANDENLIIPIKEKLNDIGFSTDDLSYTPVHHVDENSPFIQTLLSAYERHTGKKGECVAIGGGTYVHEIENGVAFGAIMPDCNTHMHGTNEFMPIKDLITAAKIYADVIIKLCK